MGGLLEFVSAFPASLAPLTIVLSFSFLHFLYSFCISCLFFFYFSAFYGLTHATTVTIAFPSFFDDDYKAQKSIN
jgi:hypothetical protein